MKEIRWNEGWKFWEDHDAFALIWDINSEAQDITLPHDAMLGKKAHLESLNGKNTGYRDGACYVYVKNIFIPEEEKDIRHILKFEGVYMNAFVYVNGQLCTKNPSGYSVFYAELDTYLNIGETNEIRVLVRAGAMPNSRWYSGAGIYRDVYLLKCNKTSIVPDGIRIHTESIDDNCALIVVESEIENRNSCRMPLVLENVIYDANGEISGSEQSILSLSEGERTVLRQRIMIQHAEFWDADHPYLYSCVSTLYQGDFNQKTEIDSTQTLTGIRLLQVDPIHGFRVNGKEVLLRGACIHHDSGILGAATYDIVQYRQIQLLKNAGFNAIRMAHQPAAPSLLRACDEIGMYVMDEYTDIWNRMKSFYDYGLFFEEWWEKDLTSMVRKDYNHPSVILYSLGNEIPEIGTDQGSSVCHRLNEKCKELDSTRFTLASINGVFAAGDSIEEILSDFQDISGTDNNSLGNINTFMALMGKEMDKIVVHPAVTRKLDKACPQTDIAGYNYMTARYRQDQKKYPNRVIVGSETYPASIAKNWHEVKDLSNVIGDFTWTGWDYLGEAGGGIPKYQEHPAYEYEMHIPQTAYGADIDLIGIRQPASYYRSIVFGLSDKPFIAVQDPAHFHDHLIKSPWMLTDAIECWNWPGYENHPVRVEVYSDADTVELYLNNELLDRKPVGKEKPYMAVFEVTYQPGELKAIACKDNRNPSVISLFTADPDRKLVLEKEHYDYRYAADDNLQFIHITAVDDQNHIAFDEAEEINIELQNCKLLGFGSGNPMPVHNFTEHTTNLHHGHALAVVQKTSDKAKITVFSNHADKVSIDI